MKRATYQLLNYKKSPSHSKNPATEVTLSVRNQLIKRWQSLASNQRLWIIFACAVAFFALIIVFDNRIAGSDDTVFIAQTAPYHNVIDWVSARYQNWSGRVVGEGVIYTFSNLPLAFWQVITIFMYALLSALLFCYYRLIISPKLHAKTDTFALVAALTMPYLLDKSVFAEGILWVTGGMVYFWSLTLMLLALYPPIKYTINQKLPPWWLIVTSFLSTIIVTFSQEQAGISLVVILLCLAVVGFRQRASSWWLHIGLLITATTCFIISLKAPGNTVRIHAETATWLPDFYTAPLSGHINDALRWTLEALINHAGFILIVLWVAVAGLLAARKQRTVIDNLLIIFLLAMSTLSLGRGFDALHYWTTFSATWHAGISSIGGSVILAPWIIVLIATPLAAIRVLPNFAIRAIVATLIVCGYGTTVMITLTPTMYASSWRSMLIPSMLLGIAAFIVALHLYRSLRHGQVFLSYIILAGASSHYLFQLARMIAQK